MTLLAHYKLFHLFRTEGVVAKIAMVSETTKEEVFKFLLTEEPDKVWKDLGRG